MVLESPDDESRSPEEQGRRIVRLDEHRAWGWCVVNYCKYRAIRDEDDRREQNRLSQQRWREKHKPESAAISRVSQSKPQSAHTEADTEADTKKERSRKRSHPPDSVDPQVWEDWLTLRKAKKAPVTATVIRSATAEAEKAGMTLDAFLRVWCARGSQGLQADWLKPHERPAFVAPQSASAVPSAEQTRAAQAAERQAPPADRAKARAALDMALGAVKRVA